MLECLFVVDDVIKADFVFSVEVINGVQTFDRSEFIHDFASYMTEFRMFVATDFDQFFKII
jgi:hypothetical protein